MDISTPPGVFVLEGLLSDFTQHVEKKLEILLSQPLNEKHLLKCLQRGEDAEFDQLLCSLGCLAEHCLPSLVEILFKWLEDENSKQNPQLPATPVSNKCETKEDCQQETRKIAIEIVFLLALIEILQQLPVHPLPEKYIQKILNLAFHHFKKASSLIHGTDQSNNKARIVAELFSEVIGVIAKTKFQSVRKKFLAEIEDAKEHSAQNILSLVMGMKFFRVKMYPVEDFEASFRFLRELADFFLEVKDKEIKHGLAALFVEILLPVAAAVKTEVNVPVLREFVDTLYPTSLEMSKRKKNQLAVYPLVTCLLCISQKQFFLNNWHIFLENCLSNLKHRDQRVSRIALESLYRLLWTYTVRIKCESNSATQSRLQSIIKSLFPFGSRAIVPKDTPLSIYVKIIQFIAQERLDFAMKEIIMDLLGINLSSSRSSRLLTLQPERMNIGLRAFLVITDSLQQKDGAPPMPSTVGIMPSGNTIRTKKVFLNKMLTEDDAKTIGVYHYHQQVQRALDWMIVSLDTQVGQKMMMTQRTSDVVSEENKPKIELFRTCVAAMPRLVPVGELNQIDLFELLSRLTIHIDEELRSLSFTTLQLFALDFPLRREDVVATFISFVLKQVNDTHPILLDTALRHLVQLISGWKNKLSSHSASLDYGSGEKMSGEVQDKNISYAPFIHRMEGFGLVLLCSNRSVMRKLACMLLKEIKLLSKYLNYTKNGHELCLDVLDRLCPQIAADTIQKQRRDINMNAGDIEKLLWVAAQNNFTKLVEYSSSWTQSAGNLWSIVISSYMKPNVLPSLCGSSVEFSWGDVNIRLEQLWQHMDLAQISTSKKMATIPNTMEQTLELWTNYLVFACSCAPSDMSLVRKQASSAIPAGTPDWHVNLLKDAERTASTSRLMEQNVANLKSENTPLKECLLQGLGFTNGLALHDLLQVLEPLIKECYKIPRQEHVRRKRKRDNLRLIVSRLLNNLASHQVLGQSLHSTNDLQENFSKVVIMMYIDNTMTYLESVDKSENTSLASSNQFAGQIPTITGTFSSNNGAHSTIATTLDDLRLYFASMITELLKHLPSQSQSLFLSSECRRTLFFMFGKWCEKYFGIGALDRLESMNGETADFSTSFHITMLRAECGVLCCGPIFDNDGLNKNSGYLYPWLEGLLDCSNLQVHDVGKEAIILLLQQNRGCQALLNWMIDKCYTSSSLVCAGCFMGICAAFSSVYEPHYLVPLLNVAVFCMGNCDILQPAKQLLILLQNRLTTESQTKKVFIERKESINNVHAENYTNLSHYILSQRIAKYYPHLTVDVLSDIFHRFQDTSPVIQRHMLQYIVPWLENIHLNEKERFFGNENEGSLCQSISMFVLSNLSFITAQYHASCELEIENCWRRLASSSLENLQYVLKFATTLLSTYFTDDIAVTAKLIATFCAKAMPKTVLNFLLEESQKFDTPKLKIVADEAESLMKFVRINCRHANEVPYQPNSPGHQRVSNSQFVVLEQNDVADSSSQENILMSNINNTSLPENIHFRRSLANHALHKPRMSLSLVSLPSSYKKSVMNHAPSDDGHTLFKSKSGTLVGTETSAVQEPDFPNLRHGPLHYLPFHEFLRGTCDSSATLLRSDVACVLLYEMVVVQGLSINVETYLPNMLLAITFGMDNTHFVEIPEKCRLLLAHVITQLLPHQEQEQVITDIMSITSTALISVLSINDPGGGLDKISDTRSSAKQEMSTFVKSFVLELFTKSRKQMWPYDDTTPANILNDIKLKGDEEITLFINNLLSVFNYLVPDLPLPQKLASQSLHFSINARPTHYKCRSLQIFRAVGIPLSPKEICSIVTPLATDQHVMPDHELQSLKIETLQTLLHSCDLILKELMDKNNKADLIKYNSSGVSTASGKKLTSDKIIDKISSESSQPSFGHVQRPLRSHSHKRSGSVTLKCKTLESVVGGCLNLNTKDKTVTINHEETLQKKGTVKMKLPPHLNVENQYVLQMFWISAVIMESNYEYEYLLGLKIIYKILNCVPLDQYDWCFNCLEYIQSFQWKTFQGIQFLLLKGLLSAYTFDLTYSALVHITTLTHLPIISTKGHGNAFATNVVLLLPYLVSKFASPDHACCECAQRIAQVCVVDFKDHLKLQSLAHVMSLYVNKTYNKALTTWISVVCKYIYETFPFALDDQIRLLTQMLDEGYSFHLQCLQIMLSLYSLSSVLSKELNEDYIKDSLKTVSKHIHGKHWKEALYILKLAVTQSSHIVSPQISADFAKESEKDFIGLPGLTMTFKLDQIKLQNLGKRSKTFHEKSESSSAVGSDRFKVLANACSFFQHHKHVKSTTLPTLQPCKETVSGKQEQDQENFGNTAFSGGNKVDSNTFLDDMNSQGVLRDFDFLNEFEMEGDIADNFNIGMHSWGPSSAKELHDKDLNVSDDPLEVFDLTTVVDMEENERVESDSSSVVTMGSVIGVSSDLSDPDIHLRDMRMAPENNVENADVEKGCTNFNQQSLATNLFSCYVRSTSPTPPVTSFKAHDEAIINNESTIINWDSPLYTRFVFNQSAAKDIGELQYDRWSALIHLMEVDKTGKAYLELFLAFQSLYHHLCVSFTTISKKGCTILGSKLAGISSHFNSMLDELPQQLLCPLCLATPNTLIIHNTALALGFRDIQEHIKFFQMKKHDTLKLIETACETYPQKLEKEQKQLELCQQLYKLHYEILILFQLFNKLVNIVSASKFQDKANTDVMNSLYRKLIQFESECKGATSESNKKEDVAQFSNPSETTKYLVQLIEKQEFGSAFQYLLLFRNQWPCLFGLENDSASAFLMNLYFWNYVKVNCKNEYQVILGTKDCSHSISQKLMEVNAQIQQSLQLLELKPKPTYDD